MLGIQSLALPGKCLTSLKMHQHPSLFVQSVIVEAKNVCNVGIWEAGFIVNLKHLKFSMKND
jgi:hypothetical protein